MGHQCRIGALRLLWLSQYRGKEGSPVGDKSPKASEKQKKQKDAKKADKAKK